jgi:hypothetical protein
VLRGSTRDADRVSQQARRTLNIPLIPMSLHYPAGWEHWLAFFTARLPAPVQTQEHEDGSLSYIAGDPGEVIVHLAHEAITVGTYTLVTAQEEGPTIAPSEVGSVRWQRLDADDALAIVERLIQAARRARRDTFSACARCERDTPPEWMFDDEICRDCARVEKRLR